LRLRANGRKQRRNDGSSCWDPYAGRVRTLPRRLRRNALRGAAPRPSGALVLKSTWARFDLVRLVDEFRRAGGDEVAAIVERVYGGDSTSVTAEEWAGCWKLFGPG
jgi:hypothetical protein